MSNPKFKKGDWCFCEFKLQQIKDTKEERITEVTDGRFSLSSYDLTDRCFPIDIRIKNISDSVDYWREQFHALKHNSLNHPDLNRELIRRWIEMCVETDDKKLQLLYDKLDEFGRGVKDAVANIKYTEVSDVRIFR